MRALVVSDSHGDIYNLENVLKKHRVTDMVLFLGDGEKDLFAQNVSEAVGNRMLVAVKGNCDWYSLLPDDETVMLGPKKIYCLHGHTKGVKHGFEMLEKYAKLQGFDIVVYGHTHEPRTAYEDGIWYMCPGSIKNGWYGIIDVDERTGSAICYIKNLFSEVN